MAPDQAYYVRLYAYNSAGKIGQEKNFIRHNLKNSSPLAYLCGSMQQMSLNRNYSNVGMHQLGDLSGNARHMNIVNGDPIITTDGHEGRSVVDFDGDDQLISTYDFASTDLQVWRNGGYTAFGVSRYTGGRSNRVISSRGQNWIMGHHGNRNGRYYFNGWVHGGYSADTKFHIWEIKQEGRSHNGNPYSTVYADGVELANNQNSNNWWHHPGQLSFGGWGDLSEASNCQVAEFLIFRGLLVVFYS